MSGLPAAPAFFFEPLQEHHRRASFVCGVQALDLYFQGDSVLQDISRKIAAVFVLTDDGHSVAGFYTLSSLSVATAALPPKLAKRLPSRLPVGVTLLGRMAVHTPHQQKGLGTYLLMDALHRSLRTSAAVASWGVVVDAKPDARTYYLKHGFLALPDSPQRLILPMKTIETLFATQQT